MDINHALNYLERHVPLSAELKRELMLSLKVVLYKKNEIIHSPSSTHKQVLYVVSGHLCKYYYHQGVRVVEFFKKDSMILTWYPGMDSDFYVKTLQDCKLVSISIARLIKLGDAYPELRKYEKMFLWEELAKKDQLISNAHRRAEDRLVALHQEFPEIFRTAPVDLLQSYLILSRETFYRLKAKTGL